MDTRRALLVDAFAEEPLRFSDIENDLGIAPNTLSARLSDLTEAGLLDRTAYDEIPPRVEYTPTERAEALFPVFAVAIAVVTLGEAVTPRLLLGVGLLVAGGVGVAGEARASPVTSSGGRVWVDVAFPVAGALFLGVDPVLTKVGLAEGTPPLVGLVVRIGAAAAGFGLYAAWRTLRRERGWRRPNRWLLVAGVANTGYLLAYYGALSRAPVAVVTPLLGVSTLFVVAGAGLFLQADERVTWRLAAAALVVVIGAAVVVGG